MKDYLCKCNNCNSILLDQNPQTGAVKQELSRFPTIKHMKYVKNGEDSFWACPICQTDEYLTDNI